MVVAPEMAARNDAGGPVVLGEVHQHPQGIGDAGTKRPAGHEVLVGMQGLRRMARPHAPGLEQRQQVVLAEQVLDQRAHRRLQHQVLEHLALVEQVVDRHEAGVARSAQVFALAPGLLLYPVQQPGDLVAGERFGDQTVAMKIEVALEPGRIPGGLRQRRGRADRFGECIRDLLAGNLGFQGNDRVSSAPGEKPRSRTSSATTARAWLIR